jgi:hypothetical protein
VSGEIGVRGSVGGVPIPSLDEPIRDVTVPLRVREVTTAQSILCGFQVPWGSGSYGDVPLEIGSGAGFGSRWATIRYGERRFAFSVDDLLLSLVAVVDAEP